MKRLGIACVLLFSGLVPISGCGNADETGKGASEKKAEMDPEQKKLMDQTMNAGQGKQFGDRATEAPEKEEKQVTGGLEFSS